MNQLYAEALERVKFVMAGANELLPKLVTLFDSLQEQVSQNLTIDGYSSDLASLIESLPKLLKSKCDAEKSISFIKFVDLTSCKEVVETYKIKSFLIEKLAIEALGLSKIKNAHELAAHQWWQGYSMSPSEDHIVWRKLGMRLVSRAVLEDPQSAAYLLTKIVAQTSLEPTHEQMEYFNQLCHAQSFYPYNLDDEKCDLIERLCLLARATLETTESDVRALSKSISWIAYTLDSVSPKDAKELRELAKRNNLRLLAKEKIHRWQNRNAEAKLLLSNDTLKKEEFEHLLNLLNNENVDPYLWLAFIPKVEKSEDNKFKHRVWEAFIKLDMEDNFKHCARLRAELWLAMLSSAIAKVDKNFCRLFSDEKVQFQLSNLFSAPQTSHLSGQFYQQLLQLGLEAIQFQSLSGLKIVRFCLAKCKARPDILAIKIEERIYGQLCKAVKSPSQESYLVLEEIVREIHRLEIPVQFLEWSQVLLKLKMPKLALLFFILAMVQNSFTQSKFNETLGRSVISLASRQRTDQLLDFLHEEPGAAWVIALLLERKFAFVLKEKQPLNAFKAALKLFRVNREALGSHGREVAVAAIKVCMNGVLKKDQGTFASMYKPLKSFFIEELNQHEEYLSHGNEPLIMELIHHLLDDKGTNASFFHAHGWQLVSALLSKFIKLNQPLGSTHQLIERCVNQIETESPDKLAHYMCCFLERKNFLGPFYDSVEVKEWENRWNLFIGALLDKLPKSLPLLGEVFKKVCKSNLLSTETALKMQEKALAYLKAGKEKLFENLSNLFYFNYLEACNTKRSMLPYEINKKYREAFSYDRNLLSSFLPYYVENINVLMDNATLPKIHKIEQVNDLLDWLKLAPKPLPLAMVHGIAQMFKKIKEHAIYTKPSDLQSALKDLFISLPNLELEFQDMGIQEKG